MLPIKKQSFFISFFILFTMVPLVAMEQQEEHEENNFRSFIGEYGLPLALTAGIGTYCLLNPNSIAKTWKCIKEIPTPVTVFATLASGYIIGNVIDNNHKIKRLTRKQEELEKKLECQNDSFKQHTADVNAAFPIVAKQLTKVHLGLETLFAMQTCTTYEQYSLRFALTCHFATVKRRLDTMQETQNGLVQLNNIFDATLARYNYETGNVPLLENANKDCTG